MARWLVRHHDDGPSAGRGLLALVVGLAAGVAAGAFLAQRFGGMSGISSRVRRIKPAGEPAGGGRPEGEAGRALHEGYDGYEDYDDDDTAAAAELETELEAEADAADARADADDADDAEDEDDAMAEDETEPFASADPELEDRVLHAFTNDP